MPSRLFFFFFLPESPITWLGQYTKTTCLGLVKHLQFSAVIGLSQEEDNDGKKMCKINISYECERGSTVSQMIKDKEIKSLLLSAQHPENNLRLRGQEQCTDST